MQTSIITRPTIASMALVIAWSATPRAGLAQQCRRTCESGEIRDVRGCCVPGAAPAPGPARPERPPRGERPARDSRQAPESEAPTARPSESPTPGQPEQPQPVRRQRKADPGPPAASSGPPEKPAAGRAPRAGDARKSNAPGSTRTDTTVPRPAEPSAPQSSDSQEPTTSRPGVSISPPAYATARPEPEPSRRWPVWIPWTVVGAGAVATGVGGLLYTAASNDYESFDKEFSETCPDGCSESEVQSLSDQLERARSMETTSRISLIVGGVTVAAGVALVFLNQVTEPTSERATARTFIVPTLGPGAAGISAGISF
jgi:hypothetical protein